MNLTIVPPQFIDQAWWKEGANCLAEVCKLVDEITADQLKLILSRGERTLVKIEEDGKVIGWGTFRVDQLPNIRVLHITDLVCHNHDVFRFFPEIAEIAKSLGCSRIRCSAPPAQARLYKMKLDFQPVYETLEVQL